MKRLFSLLTAFALAAALCAPVMADDVTTPDVTAPTPTPTAAIDTTSSDGQATDIKIHADHIVRIREKMNTLLSQYTGQPLDVITRDTERDNYMTAQQAKEYGLIDDILYKH